MILAALNEVQIAGARLDSACQMIGLSARTIQRWKGHPEADDRRCGPRHRPGPCVERTRGKPGAGPHDECRVWLSLAQTISAADWRTKAGISHPSPRCTASNAASA